MMGPTASELALIAHRGGVVDRDRSENSLKALEEAIRRGYTHVEIDARITADGHVVCFHNDELMEEAGVDGRISEMPRDAVKQVVLTRSGEGIPRFDEYCARCAGRIGVMVDLKGCRDGFIDRYTGEIEAALAAHGLLRDAMILINKEPVDNQDRIARRFLGKAIVSWRKPLAQTRGPAAPQPDQEPGLGDRGLSGRLAPGTWNLEPLPPTFITCSTTVRISLWKMSQDIKPLDFV